MSTFGRCFRPRVKSVFSQSYPGRKASLLRASNATWHLCYRGWISGRGTLLSSLCPFASITVFRTGPSWLIHCSNGMRHSCMAQMLNSKIETPRKGSMVVNASCTALVLDICMIHFLSCCVPTPSRSVGSFPCHTTQNQRRSHFIESRRLSCLSRDNRAMYANRVQSKSEAESE